jgi:hypothetical protein
MVSHRDALDRGEPFVLCGTDAERPGTKDEGRQHCEGHEDEVSHTDSFHRY